MSVSMLPKVIHYCWFGGNLMPETEQLCLDSWNRVLKDYKIVRWDEKNFDISSSIFAMQAYERKKWAFVSDYARYKILYEHGGVYMDTDVEVIRRFDDLLFNEFFMGFEDNNMLAPGLVIGAQKGHHLLKMLMKRYETEPFVNQEGNMNLTAVGIYASKLFQSIGFRLDNTLQQKDGISIYPMEYFCPKNPKTGHLIITPNTYSIHHYSASWYTDSQRKKLIQSQRTNAILGIRLGKLVNTTRIVIARYGVRGAISKAFQRSSSHLKRGKKQK